MSSPQTDYYAVLGLNAQAKPDEIKKRYRELARRYHPDVNRSPDAAQKIKVVNEAYHVLGDTERRATYDAARVFQFPPRSSQAASNPAAPPSRPAPSPDARTAPNGQAYGGRRSPTPPRPPRPAAPQANGDFDFNGFGRVVNEAAERAQAERAAQTAPPPNTARPSAARPASAPNGSAANTTARPANAPFNPAPRRSPAQRKTEDNAAQVQQLLSEAKLAFVNRQYAQTTRLCREAIALDRSNAVAHELMGDSARKQGDTDAAIQSYSFAIQLNPRNQSVQANLNRLMGHDEKHAQAGPKLARAVPVPLANRLGRDAIVNGTGGLALVGMVALLGGLYVVPGAVLIGDLSLNLVLALAGCGLLGGFLLALYGGLRPQSAELATRGGGRNVLPLGSVLSLFALVWFGASLLAYMAVAVTQNRVSPSVLRAYGLTLFLSVVFVLLYHPLSGGVGGARIGFSVMAAVVAGNFLFPMILLGWRVGDALRLRSFSVS